MTVRAGETRSVAWRRWARNLLRLRPVRFDWVDAIRAGGCAGGVVLIGWWVGDISAGLTASVGAFTALYGGGRPYRSRARMLALIALGFAAAVTLGAFSESSAWATVVVVAVIAVVATWLSHAVEIGPPGAYMFVLAGATASSIPGAADEPWRLGLLVLAGGALSCLAHLSGILAGPRRPEKAVLAAGTAAVARLLEAAGPTGSVDSAGRDRYPAARDQAARAMHRCWVALVGQQPRVARAGGTLERLRAIALDVHGLMAEAVRAHDDGHPVDPDAAARLRGWADAVADPPPSPARLAAGAVPLGGPGAARSAAEMISPGSPWRPVLARVGVAALVAGGIGSVLGLDHAYWAVASAVLVLWQGLGWAGTLERAALRLLGTWIGLLVAAAVLAAQPAGVWLAATVVVLQGAVQLAMPRNYGLGVVIVTPLALTIGSGGHPSDLGELLFARGLDTVIGCGIGVLVFLAIRPGAALPDPVVLVADTLRDAARVIPHLADHSTAGPDARRARRDLNQRLLGLADAHQAGDLAAPVGHRSDTTWWPALDATQRLGYRVLAACWAEDAAPAGPPSISAGRAAAIDSELAQLREATGPAGRSPAPEPTPQADEGFLAPELAALRLSLPRWTAPGRRAP